MGSKDNPGSTPGNKGKKISIEHRTSKVDITDFASLPDGFSWYESFRKMIPRILRGKDLEDLSERVVRARRRNRPVIIMMGAHVVKCGLGGLICELMRKGVVTALAMNGACAIHDVEIAMWGRTSEDVEAGLEDGTFGTTEETSVLFNDAASGCLGEEIGLGNAIGERLCRAQPRNPEVSVIATAHKLGIPVTVHVAIGTDVVHQHDEADGKAIGSGTMRDFRTFASMIANLSGGVILNLGSAVIMPEVFLKALAKARSAGSVLGEFTTANFDMFSLYRPTTSVVRRPKSMGATTFNFLGHHEILLPVLVASVLSKTRI
ncbi:MAG: hypothetical protein ABIJ00_10305 [Candidatus Eisenbacteria bacterium]